MDEIIQGGNVEEEERAARANLWEHRDTVQPWKKQKISKKAEKKYEEK